MHHESRTMPWMALIVLLFPLWFAAPGCTPTPTDEGAGIQERSHFQIGTPTKRNGISDC